MEEFNLEDLDKVTAGMTQDVAEDLALQSLEIYRETQIRALLQETENLVDFSSKTLEELKDEYANAKKHYYSGNTYWKATMDSLAKEIIKREQQSKKNNKTL